MFPLTSTEKENLLTRHVYPQRHPMVSASGVRRNANWNDIQSEVTLDDLFAF